MKKFAIVLPQFHQDDENNRHWGEGFTDWDSCNNAIAIFRDHLQPQRIKHQYDLSKSTEANDLMLRVKSHGFDAAAIYSYDFDISKSALSTGTEKLRSNKHGVPYFNCWVNANWTKSWVGDNSTVIYEQSYTYDFMKYLVDKNINCFNSNNYYHFNGRPIFYVHNPDLLADKGYTCELLRSMFNDAGYNPILIGPMIHSTTQLLNLDYYMGYPPGDLPLIRNPLKRIINKYTSCTLIRKKLFRVMRSEDYNCYATRYERFVSKMNKDSRYVATVLAGWDNTPRYANGGYVLRDTTDRKLQNHINLVAKINKQANKPFLFVKAFNEWAEGNYIEFRDVIV